VYVVAWSWTAYLKLLILCGLCFIMMTATAGHSMTGIILVVCAFVGPPSKSASAGNVVQV
jgi:hypothetical protein